MRHVISALVMNELRDGIRLNWRCAVAAPAVVRGFLLGLRHRQPVRPEVSRFYRMNYWLFANWPWENILLSCIVN